MEISLDTYQTGKILKSYKIPNVACDDRRTKDLLVEEDTKHSLQNCLWKQEDECNQRALHYKSGQVKRGRYKPWGSDAAIRSDELDSLMAT